MERVASTLRTEESTELGSLAQRTLLVLMAISSITLIEPAPYDLLAVLFTGLLLLGGMRIPSGLFLPMSMVGIFMLGNVISTTQASDVPRALWYGAVTAYLLVTWFLFTCVVYNDPQRALGIIWKGYVLAAVLAVLLGTAGYFGAFPGAELFQRWGRAKGGFKDANVYGPFLVPVAVYMISRMKRGISTSSVVWMGMFLVVAFGILISFSRAAWGNLIVSLMIFFVLRWRLSNDPEKFLKGLVKTFGLALLGAIIIFFVARYTPIGETLAIRAQITQSYDTSEDGRFVNQLLALQTSIGTPLGIGPGHSEIDLYQATHSLYLRVIVENGVIAMLAFIILLATTLTRCYRLCIVPWRFQLDATVVFAVLMGQLVNSIVIDSLHWRHLFLLLGLAWGLWLVYCNEGGSQAERAVDRQRNDILERERST